MDQELKDALDEIKRDIQQTRGRLERQQDDFHLFAQAIIATNDRLSSFREEVSREFELVRDLLPLRYLDLEGRIRTVELWKTHTERDPLDSIRELLGKPKD